MRWFVPVALIGLVVLFVLLAWLRFNSYATAEPDCSRLTVSAPVQAGTSGSVRDLPTAMPNTPGLPIPTINLKQIYPQGGDVTPQAAPCRQPSAPQP